MNRTNKPPPIALYNTEPTCHDTAVISIAESPIITVEHYNIRDEELEETELLYQQFEGTLIGLLRDDELLPFNIHTAASLGTTASVRHLVERCNVDPNSRNLGNWTALMYASLFCHNETVLYLLEMKADVNAKNPFGKTALMLAAACGSDETIRLLLQHGASLEERDQEQFTALMLAIAATHCESANILLECGANPNVREGIHGQSALYIAAQTGQFAIARALIQSGVDVNAQTSSGDTAYHAALRNGYPAIANLIKEKQQKKEELQSTLGLMDPVGSKNKKRSRPPTHLALAPTQYRPKSPYTAFFERLPDPVNQIIPEVIVQDVDSGIVSEPQHWFPSPSDITSRCSPEGVEEESHPDNAAPNFNLFSAWPGSSMILRQALPSVQQQQKRKPAPSSFKKSITKPVRTSVTTPITPINPWSPTGERFPLYGEDDHHKSSSPTVKLPKDLSSVLADLGLTKYQSYFEEQDIDLQVFLTMNEADLREIGINSLGARRKCLSTIAYYQMRSNHYRIGEEFMVNTWVSKRDLTELKAVWRELTVVVTELSGFDHRAQVGNSQHRHLVDRLVKQMQRAENFFQKY